MNEYEKKLIDDLLEEKNLEYLKCNNLYKLNYQDAYDILNLEFWNYDKFKKLLTRSVWATTANKISEILSLEYWNDYNFIHLLTPTIISASPENIKNNIEFFYTNGIIKYLNPTNVRRHYIQNILIFDALRKKCISPIVGDTINPLFCYGTYNSRNLYNDGGPSLHPAFNYDKKRLKEELNIDLDALYSEYVQINNKSR